MADESSNMFDRKLVDHHELLDLLARCRLRDQYALKSLYDQVGAYLNAIAFRIVANDEWANEVLEETFIQIWENAAAYHPNIASPLAWMSGIVRYRALDRMAKEQTDSRPLFEQAFLGVAMAC